VGIIEPRKNQLLLLDVAEKLIEQGTPFRLDVVGRINPHFGASIAQRLRRLAARYSQIRYHGAASDEVVAGLWRNAHASVFPTLAEGCGLPLLESLARGVPCVASDLPVLRETGEGGGCVFAAANDRTAWVASLTRVLTDLNYTEELRTQARSRVLPTWAHAADQLVRSLNS
jgi:glycosyltransferase involved in cell wall biosynthesis